MNTLKKIFRALSVRERILFVGALCVALGAMVTLGTIILRTTTVIVPADGGEYIEGVASQPTFVNPVIAKTDADRHLVRLLFSPLTDLAQKIEPDPNGRVWRVRLKEGLVWSDRRKLTADDVVFTVQRIQDPETRSPLFGSWQGITVTRLSEIEIQFTLGSPYAFFADNLRNLYLIPKHLFADTPPANWRLSDYNLGPIGAGPYTFSSYDKQPDGFIKYYTVVRNPYYIGARPHLDSITLRFFPNTADLLAAFNAGTIDGFADMNPDTPSRIQRSYNVTHFELPGYYAVFFNQGQHIALKEKSVREALILALDRPALARTIFGDDVRAIDNPVPTLARASVPGPDLDRARALLDQAEWIPQENGPRQKVMKDTTVKLEFELLTPRLPFLERTAEELAASWRAVGANVTIRTLPPEDILEKAVKNREYQAVLFGNFLNPADDLYPFWHSNERFYPGLNLSLYNNKQVDDAIEKMRRTLAPEERQVVLGELRNMIVADAPAAFLYSPPLLFVTSKSLKGATSTVIADPSERWRSISAWHLNTTRAFR